jgi:hypothetical protein
MYKKVTAVFLHLGRKILRAGIKKVFLKVTRNLKFQMSAGFAY